VLENATQLNPTQPNPWMDPTHVYLWRSYCQWVSVDSAADRYRRLQMGHCLTDCPSNTDGVVWQLRVNIAHTVTLSIHTEQINIQIPYLPIKQFSRRCHLPLPKVVIARWRTARVIISLFLSNQSQRSSFAVIGYAEAGRRRSPTTCRLLYRRIP